MKKFHITYITTNLVNNKQYVGDHSTNNINDSYLGSGTLVLKAIKKYGRENFKREIIQICESKEEAFNLQEKYIKEYNTLYPAGYNISPKGGHNTKNCFSVETKRKIGKSSKGRKWSEESRKKVSDRVSGKDNPMYRRGYKISGEKNGIFGGHTEEAKIKMRKAKSKSHIENLKKSLNRQKKYRCPHCNKIYQAGNLTRHLYRLENKKEVTSEWVLEILRNKDDIALRDKELT